MLVSGLSKVKIGQTSRFSVFTVSYEYSGLSIEWKQILRIFKRSAKTIVEVNWKQLMDFQLLFKLADNSFVLMHLEKVCI